MSLSNPETPDAGQQKSWGLSPVWKRILKFFAWFILVDIAIVLLVTLVMHFKVSAAEEKLEEEFAQTIGTIDERFLEEFPKTPENQAALDLDIALNPLGLVLSPAQQPNAAAKTRFKAVSWNDLINGVLENPGTEIQLDDPIFLSFVASTESEVEGLLGELDKGLIPAWEITPGDFSSPTPNFQDHLGAQRMLLSLALLRAHQENHSEALRLFNGALILRRSLEQRPDLISQLIARSAAALQSGAARKMAMPVSDWQTARADFNPEANLHLAIRGESHLHWFMGQDPIKTLGGSAQLPGWQKVLFFNFITKPWIRREGVEMLKGTMALHHAAEKQSGCTYDLDADMQEIDDNMKGILAKIIFPSLSDNYSRFRQAQWQWDFTSRWLLFRQELAKETDPVALLQSSEESWQTWLEGRGLLDGELCTDNDFLFKRSTYQFILTVEKPEVGLPPRGPQIPLEMSWAVPGLEAELVVEPEQEDTPQEN